MISSKLIRFLDLFFGQIISQNSGCYPTKDKKDTQKLDRIFIFEKIKKLFIAHGQGYQLMLRKKKRLRRVWIWRTNLIQSRKAGSKMTFFRMVMSQEQMVPSWHATFAKVFLVLYCRRSHHLVYGPQIFPICTLLQLHFLGRRPSSNHKLIHVQAIVVVILLDPHIYALSVCSQNVSC